MNADEYKQRFEKAYSLLVEAHAFFFVWKGLQKKEYEQYWKELYFWNAVICALDRSWMLSLAKIYENSTYSEKDEIISIYSLVEHQPDEERKKKAKEILENKSEILKNISIIRHNLGAHNNAKHTLAPNDLFKKFPLKSNEIDSLFEMTIDIFHLLHPENDYGLNMDQFNEMCVLDVKMIMKKLKYYDNERQKHYEKCKKGEIPQSVFPPDMDFS